MAKQQIPGSTECLSSLEKKHAVEIMRTTNTENAIIDVTVYGPYSEEKLEWSNYQVVKKFVLNV